MIQWGVNLQNSPLGAGGQSQKNAFILHDSFYVKGPHRQINTYRKQMEKGWGVEGRGLGDNYRVWLLQGSPGGSDSEESACNVGDPPRFDPWMGKMLWRSKWLPTPVFSPGESHGQRRLAGCSSNQCSVVSDSLQPHGLQHARPPSPSPTPGVYSNSCPSSR